jgi:hypothetical protein
MEYNITYFFTAYTMITFIEYVIVRVIQMILNYI